jgi:hypothetical protein
MSYIASQISEVSVEDMWCENIVVDLTHDARRARLISPDVRFFLFYGSCDMPLARDKCHLTISRACLNEGRVHQSSLNSMFEIKKFGADKAAWRHWKYRADHFISGWRQIGCFARPGDCLSSIVSRMDEHRGFGRGRNKQRPLVLH